MIGRQWLYFGVLLSLISVPFALHGKGPEFEDGGQHLKLALISRSPTQLLAQSSLLEKDAFNNNPVLVDQVFKKYVWPNVDPAWFEQGKVIGSDSEADLVLPGDPTKRIAPFRISMAAEGNKVTSEAISRLPFSLAFRNHCLDLQKHTSGDSKADSERCYAVARYATIEIEVANMEKMGVKAILPTSGFKGTLSEWRKFAHWCVTHYKCEKEAKEYVASLKAHTQ